jgi:hypothetical protein
VGRAAAAAAACVLVVFLYFALILGVLGLGQNQANEVPLWFRNIETWAGIFQALITSLAIIVGGIVTYYRFFKERTHASTIQPSISYSMAREGGIIYLQVSASATNIGQSKVDINHDFTALRVSTRRRGDEGWTWQHTYDVLTQQGWVEPGETVGEPVWVEIGRADNVAVRLDLYIAEGEKVGWIASEVVNLVSGGNNEGET